MDDPSTSGPAPGPRNGKSDRDPSVGAGGTASHEAGIILPTADDADAARERITRFIRGSVDSAGADGVVVHLSGGIDSAVTATLAAEALGPARVYGLILPCNKLGEPSARNAETLADALDIQHDTIHLQPLFAQFGSVIDGQFDFHDDPILAESVIARIRTTLSYLAAEASDSLVCGTTNRSDRLLGTLPAYCDSTADLSPIGHLYRTDVGVLADRLGLPEFVTDHSRRTGHVPGYVEGVDLDIPDECIDEVLHRHVDDGLDSDELATELDLDPETVSTVLARYDRTERRRRRPRRLDPQDGTH